MFLIFRIDAGPTFKKNRTVFERGGSTSVLAAISCDSVFFEPRVSSKRLNKYIFYSSFSLLTFAAKK